MRYVFLKNRPFTAIILAAGRSVRMGCFKPAVLIGDKPAIAHCIDTFLDAGVKDIIVVLGSNKELLTGILNGYSDIRPIYNKDYVKGMFTSVKAGVKALMPDGKGFFITPTDIPLFSVDTVMALMENFEDSPMNVLSPSYSMRAGHPTLCSMDVAKRILAYEYDTLRAVFSDCNRSFLNVDDYGILLDMDTPEDYLHLIAYYNGICRSCDLYKKQGKDENA